MKQNVFEYASWSNTFQATLQLSPETIYGLLGIPLSDEQLLKLDNTTLMDVISEETGIVPAHHGDEEEDGSAKAPKDSAPSGEDDGVPPPEGSDAAPAEGEEGLDKESAAKPLDEDPEDFHNFLKLQIASEKDLPKPPEVVKAEGEDADKIYPYSSDLDYLGIKTPESYYFANFCPRN